MDKKYGKPIMVEDINDNLQIIEYINGCSISKNGIETRLFYDVKYDLELGLLYVTDTINSNGVESRVYYYMNDDLKIIGFGYSNLLDSFYTVNSFSFDYEENDFKYEAYDESLLKIEHCLGRTLDRRMEHLNTNAKTMVRSLKTR